MSDQKVGKGMVDVLRWWVKWMDWGVKWGIMVLGVGVLDEWALGGRGVVGVVRGLYGRGMGGR